MKLYRLQLNGMTDEQWDRLAALAVSSHMTRSAYIRRILRLVVEEGYIPRTDYPRQRWRFSPAEARRMYPHKKINVVGWYTTYNLVIATRESFLKAIDETMKRYSITTRHMFVYQCVAWACDVGITFQMEYEHAQER